MTSATLPAPQFPAPRGWRGRLPLSHRVMLAIGALLTLVTISLLLAVGLVTRLAAGESRLNGRDVPFASYVGSVALAAKGVANDERGFLISGDRAYVVEADDRIAEARSALAGARREAPDAQARATMGRAGDSFERWVARLQQEFAVYPNDRAAAISASLGPNRELRKSYESDLAQAQALARRTIAQGDSSFALTVSWSTRILLGCLVAALAFGVLVGAWIVRLIALPLQRLLTILSA